MTGYKVREKRRRTKLWLTLIVLTAATIGISIWLAGPSPPKTIKLATGQPGGGYDKFGQDYKERLHKMGLEVELVNTNGSIDNLHRLIRGEVDVAFGQGGTYQVVEDEDTKKILRGMAAIYLEPLWVFYRGKETARTLADLQGKTISIGLPESGTEVVGRELLHAHGIDDKNSTLVNLGMAESGEKLKKGELGAAMFVSTAGKKMKKGEVGAVMVVSGGIMDLLAQPDIQLMNFSRQDLAHSRLFPYLRPVRLSEGLLDLKHNLPRQEETLLAPAALLVCRENLHPRVVEQVLKVANFFHSSGNQLDEPNRFPTLDGLDMLPHDTAETYMKSGESFLSRILPYWGQRLFWQLRLLILPLLAVWLPFIKILPMIYTYRVNRLLKLHYAALRDVEGAIATASQPQELKQRLQTLENLRVEMEGLSRKVPAHLQRDVYHWRLHVSLVRMEALDRLARMEGKSEAGAHASFLPNMDEARVIKVDSRL